LMLTRLFFCDTNSLVSYRLAGSNYRQGKNLIYYALPLRDAHPVFG